MAKKKYEKKIDMYTTPVIKQEPKKIHIPITPLSEPKITLNEYLSRYSTQHKHDNVIRRWYQSTDPKNEKKTKNDWDKVLKIFFGGKD